MSCLRVQLGWRREAFHLAVDFTTPACGITAVFGASGSGKTTVLRCIAGLERATEGLVEIESERWQDSRHGVFLPVHQRRLGYVFQDAALLEHLAVRANLEYGLHRTPKSDRVITLPQAVDWCGIGHLLTRRVAGLSGGERSRVAIARALVTSPHLLLMDEPLAALDTAAKADILPVLEHLHAELAVPMLYVSHAVDEVARLADYLVYLEQGRTLAHGPLTEVLTRTDLPLARTDEASAVVEARVRARDDTFHLAILEFGGQTLRVADTRLAPGATTRLRILARDVSLSLARHDNTSILNVFPVTLRAVSQDHPSQALVSLDAGGTPMLARITRKSWYDLGLVVGQQVYAQVKSVAILR
jgi:molybdate transport system ATP-binding protein